MLHENPLMVDIDVDHWRNLQELFLESSKEKRRIVLIHEDGTLLKFVHSGREPIVRSIARVENPERDAEKVYRDNKDKADFVLVLERRAVERYVAEVQDSWSADEDLDVYVRRMYMKLGDYPQGIVTYPGSPQENLGLQWRIGVTYEEFRGVLALLVKPETTAVLALFDRGSLWASLVLGFNAKMQIDLITTAPEAEANSLLSSDREKAAALILQAVESKYPRSSLGLFAELRPFRTWLHGEDKLEKLSTLVEKGDFLFRPVPKQFEALIQVR